MKVLFKDEKYTSETIDILEKLMEDGNIRSSQVRMLIERVMHIHVLYIMYCTCMCM